MPEQLTRHPEVTLQVLRSAGARCGEGAPQEILKQCPAERFCKLPGGEVCVYGLPEAGRMTQVSAAEWQAIVPAPTASHADAAAWIAGAAGLAVGALLALALQRTWRARRRTS
jgi:hypothetical protein